MLLGEKLKKARKNIGMSQNEVAEELMLSRQTISKWENNVCFSKRQMCSLTANQRMMCPVNDVLH